MTGTRLCSGGSGGVVPIHYEVQGHTDYLELVCTADYAPDLPVRIAAEGLRRASRAGHRALLLDIRGVTGRAPTMSERYEQAVQFADLQAQTTPRIKVALLGTEPMIHPQRFGEIVATNRGAQFRAFTDEAAALEWLLGKKRAH